MGFKWKLIKLAITVKRAEGKVTGIIYVDLSAAYDTIDHIDAFSKIVELTKDIHLTELTEKIAVQRVTS